MAYSELIKNFNRIRDYMREFYVYGFKSRDEYTKKSARSYDDERRRVESWLGEYMQFRQTAEGRNVFISIDSRSSQHNPLYAAWKTKSFTDGDITLHFLLFDILHSPQVELTLKEILEQLDRRTGSSKDPWIWDESTVRKKLKEYVGEGIISSRKKGRVMYYQRTDDPAETDRDLLDFFSEAAPCGVVGSFLLDKQEKRKGIFYFKHHYITGALDSEILAQLFCAMREKRYITLEVINRRRDRIRERQVVPLKIMISAQNGRQHLMAYSPGYRGITSFRIDNLLSVKQGEVCPEFEYLRELLARMMPHIWGVSTRSMYGHRMEHIEFTVFHAAHETYIQDRMEREKRCGTIERLDQNRIRFSADVYDASEMIPWIRTFICRITEFHCSDQRIEELFLSDLSAMYSMYGLDGQEGGDGS